jgi:hypothetical protein
MIQSFAPPSQQSLIANVDDTLTSVVSVAVNDVGANLAGDKRDDQAEIKRLKAANDTYMTYRPLWDFYLAAYEGGQSFAKADNIFKHPREHPQDFDDRARRLYYHNFCFPLVDFFTTFIFTETIQRDGAENTKWYNDFTSNVNNRGDDITSFMMSICDDMQVYGLMYVLVDAPPKPQTDGIITVAQETELNLRPYWVPVRPDEVLDWVVDDFDKFIYLKRQEIRTEFNDQTMKVITVERYTEWTNSKVVITEVVNDGKAPRIRKTQTLNNELGIVPVEAVRFKRSKLNKFMGESFLRDLAFVSREVMNLTSLLQEFLYRQCFNILAMPEDPNVPEQDSMQGEVGTANMLRFPTGTAVPHYLTPPVQPAEFLQKERESNINAMYRVAAQDTVNELFNGGKSSGFSKSQSFQRTVPKIATRADSLESLEMRLMNLTMKYLGKTWDGTIKYKDHYEVTNLADSLNQMGMLFKDLQIQSKTFASTQLKRMVAEFDGKLSADDRALVDKEIDSINWDEWFDMHKLAYIGRAATSPDAGLAFDATDPGSVGAQNAPVKGKDTPTSPTTPKRPQGTSAEIQAESSKQPKK